MRLISDKPAGPAHKPTTGKPSATFEGFDDAINEGGRNDALARLTGHLIARSVAWSVTPYLVHGFNLVRCVPPLPEEEVYRIIHSICAAEGRKRGDT